MIRLAFRNLFQNKGRLVISVGGVALSLLLVLALDAVFAGVERRITAYIERSGADVWVSQEDVLNMHMASSSLPDSVARKVRHMPGVAAASSILYLTNNVPSFVDVFLSPSANRKVGRNTGLYANDSWRMSSRFTANLGLRFDRYRNYVPPQVGPRASRIFCGVSSTSDRARFPGVPSIPWPVRMARFTSPTI